MGQLTLWLCQPNLLIMHMKRNAMMTSLSRLGLLLSAAVLVAVMLLPGCGGGSSGNADHQLLGSFSGDYSYVTNVVTTTTNGATITTNSSVYLPGPIVLTNSGPTVTSLNITQSQGQMQAVDNNGDVFTGTFSIVYAYGGNVQLQGQTVAGPVQIVGYLEASGSNAWINASWIEPNLTSTMFAIAPITPFSPANPAVWTP
jgi:hypothetical protein